MVQEYDGLCGTRTFRTVWQPAGANVVAAKWVYTWKTNEHGSVVEAKARLAARGLNQQQGIYYFETFAPTPACSCFRLLVSITCHLNSDLCHFDVKQVCVHSDPKTYTYMCLSEGCGSISDKIVPLNRSM